MKSGDNKKFDLIIFGATGFTGKLVCEYIKKKYSKSNLNWGIAGRNKQKLALLCVTATVLAKVSLKSVWGASDEL